ncbi:hypothetical protein LOTGIDRAFT_153850 [Lottia gigantea]|uniref:Uncharacterized protein n=1 Tax=Lottia gigantea TaxID=225164 RepID=V4ADM2_LOTGI|nr:hypothetical protein LOTGIDRAFT_153850 [Lottia gigantea]ESO91411.1 hypothetical protein LOTGIDRAFT_153850 [Lottia gigantea]
MPGFSKKRGNNCEKDENATIASVQNIEDLDIILSECSCQCCQNLQTKTGKRKMVKQKGRQGKSKLFRRCKSLDSDETNFSEVGELNVKDFNKNEIMEKSGEIEPETCADLDSDYVMCFDFLSDESEGDSDNLTLKSDSGSRFGNYQTLTDSWDPWNGSTIQIGISANVEEEPFMWNLPRMPYQKLLQSLGNIKARSNLTVYFQECKGFWGHTGDGCLWCKEGERKPLYKR